MHSNARRAGWILAVVVAVAAASSAFTIFAESRVRPQGTYRAVVTSGRGVSLPFLVTFQGNGGIVTSTIPLGCLAPGEVMTPGHGSWEVRLLRGIPTAVFTVWADVYSVNPSSAASSFEGSIQITGTSPVTLGKISGAASFSFPPGPCGEAFGGPATFTAFELPAVQRPAEN